MATDLTLILPDRIGSIASLMEVLDGAGTRIVGQAGFPAWAGEGILHLIVDDVEVARRALHGAGIEVREERQVIVVGEPASSRPASTFRAIADAGVNVDLVYSLADGRLAIGVNDLEQAQAAVDAL